MRAHSSPRPLDLRPRHLPLRPRSPLVFLVFFLLPPNVTLSRDALVMITASAESARANVRDAFRVLQPVASVRIVLPFFAVVLVPAASSGPHGSPRPADDTGRALTRMGLVFSYRSSFFPSPERWSSPARAHDTTSAGRVKRLVGCSFRRRVSAFSSGRPTHGSPCRLRVLSFFVVAASGGSRVMRARSSTRPLDLRPRHLVPCPSLSFVVFVFFVFHPT